MRQEGFFVIADLSGYTRLLTQSELEQAQAVVRNLLSTLLEQTRPPLIVSRLEGDAIFSYAPEGSFLQGQTLHESLENMYCAFRRALEQEERNTGCDCQACSIRPTLDLKVIVHHGQYVVEKVGQTQVLHGADVIVAHRLLKNSIAESTGIQAYLFFTESAAKAMALGSLVETMRLHTETYEHLGEVKGYVCDLHPVWERERQKGRILVEPDDDLWFAYEVEVPVPPALAWDYLHMPEKKRQWLQLDGIRVTSLRKGRVGAGTVHQCVQGRQTWRHFFVDWRPFEYATAEYLLPLRGISRITLALTPRESGTRVCVRSAKPQGSRQLQTAIIRGFMAPLRSEIETGWRKGLLNLREIIEADIAAGRILTHTEPRRAQAA
ncbi:MAG TPA: DUF2652 domain-containing protein [Anaerolineales bacterium]|nr:DUF2652 domain-containing protein [Anaerolineales bacterium]